MRDLYICKLNNPLLPKILSFSVSKLATAMRSKDKKWILIKLKQWLGQPECFNDLQKVDDNFLQTDDNWKRDLVL